MLIELSVNGRTVTAEAEARTTLLDFLRDRCGLTGSHAGCEHGVCGTCTLLVNGEAVRGCLILAVQAQGDEIVTIEGAAGAFDQLAVLQDAFMECHAMQCGYCTSGMMLTAMAMLGRKTDLSEDDIHDGLSANLCRCTGYRQIVEAITLASRRLRERNL